MFSSHFRKSCDKANIKGRMNLRIPKFKNFKTLNEVLINPDFPNFLTVFIDFIKQEIVEFENDQKKSLFKKMAKKGYHNWTIKRMLRAFNHIIILKCLCEKRVMNPLNEEFLQFKDGSLRGNKNIKTVYSKSVEECLKRYKINEEDYLKKLRSEGQEGGQYEHILMNSFEKC